MGFYIGLSWLGAAIGTSPHRSIGTVALAPLFVFLAHWAYGQGVNKAWREVRKTGGAAGVGRQIDDRERTLGVKIISQPHNLAQGLCSLIQKAQHA